MNWLRRWLGLDIMTDLSVDNYNRLCRIENKLGDMEHNTRVSHRALGEIVAKLSPLLAIPEDDPSRVAASKDLGEKVIKKLKEEQSVLDHYGYSQVKE